MEEIFTKAKYMTILCNSSYDAKKEVKYIQLAAEFRFAGVIMMTTVESKDIYNMLDRLSCPVVLLNRYLKKRNYDAIIQDNFSAAYRATNFLIQRGHKKILHLAGIKGASASDERLEGFLAAMADADLAVGEGMVVHSGLMPQDGVDLANRLIADQGRITAVFIANFSMAVSFIQTWWEAKKGIPDDISVLVYDRTPLMDMMPVKITTIGVDSLIMGEETANRLMARINGDQGPKRRIVLEAELKVYDSVKSLAKQKPQQ
jgi:LacI family transcriptional regulator